MTETRASLKAYQNAGFKPSAGNMLDLIDALVHLTEDAATSAETATGTATDKFVTPAGLAALTATAARVGIVELATDAEAKAETDAGRAITPDNLAQGAPAIAAGTLEAMFGQHYQITPDAVDADVIHAAITLPETGTTAVTTAITSPDVPRILSITGNAAGITGNVVIAGTNIAGEAIADTIAAVDDGTIDGAVAFATVTSITVPARNAEGDTISVGVGKSFGLPHIVGNAALLLVKLFDGSADDGVLTVDADEIEKNLFALDGTPDGEKLIDLYYLV